MPSAVAISNVTPPAGAGAESETVNAKVVVPLLPSASVTSLIVRFAAASSLLIVPVPWPVVMLALTTLVTLTKNVSAASGVMSPSTSTVNV